MRFLSYLMAGVVAFLPHTATGEEPAAPPQQAQQESIAGEEEAKKNETSVALPQELEDIRRALGPDYSVDSWQPELRYTPAGPENRPPSQLSKEQKDLARELKSLGDDFRKSARRLELLAAEAEDQQLYPVADRLRELARGQWEAAREVRGPMAATPPPVSPPPAYGPAAPRSEAAASPFHPYPAIPRAPSPLCPWRGVPAAVPPSPSPEKPQVDGHAPR